MRMPEVLSGADSSLLPCLVMGLPGTHTRFCVPGVLHTSYKLDKPPLVAVSTSDLSGLAYKVKSASHIHWALVSTASVAPVPQEVFKTQYYLCIAMEFCDGGDLSQYIDNRTHHRVFGLPENQARWLFQQLMVAVDYCHRLGIVNRDIKVLAGQRISLGHCLRKAPYDFISGTFLFNDGCPLVL